MNSILWGGIILAFVMCALALAYIVFYFVGVWKLYKKAGKEGWESIIPFYSDWVMVEIVGLKWYWFLFLIAGSLVTFVSEESTILTIASIAALIGEINVCYNLSKRCNKPTSWFILSIFFSGITIPLLGFSKTDVFNKNIPVSENGFFDKDKVVMPNQQYNNYQQPMNNGYQQPNNNQQDYWNRNQQ